MNKVYRCVYAYCSACACVCACNACMCGCIQVSMRRRVECEAKCVVPKEGRGSWEQWEGVGVLGRSIKRSGKTPTTAHACWVNNWSAANGPCVVSKIWMVNFRGHDNNLQHQHFHCVLNVYSSCVSWQFKQEENSAKDELANPSTKKVLEAVCKLKNEKGGGIYILPETVKSGEERMNKKLSQEKKKRYPRPACANPRNLTVPLLAS